MAKKDFYSNKQKKMRKMATKQAKTVQRVKSNKFLLGHKKQELAINIPDCSVWFQWESSGWIWIYPASAISHVINSKITSMNSDKSLVVS